MDREKESEELIKQIRSLQNMEINTSKSHADQVKNNDETRRYQPAPNNLWRPITAKSNNQISAREQRYPTSFTNNQYYTREQKYPSLFYGNCYTCNNFGHTAADCKAPIRRNLARTTNTNLNQIRSHNRYDPLDKNPFLILNNYEDECTTCNNFGHSAQDC